MRPALVSMLVLLAACGGPEASQPTQPTPLADFECKERRAAYIVTGSFAGPEVGVLVDCSEIGPRLRRWQVLSDAGDRKTAEHSLTPDEFNTLWKTLESAGWRNLGDCDNPEAVEGDPEYKIGIKDNDVAVSLTCAGKQLPFPYNRLVNELDLKAAEYGD